jgi:hypothetical protein
MNHLQLVTLRRTFFAHPRFFDVHGLFYNGLSSTRLPRLHTSSPTFRPLLARRYYLSHTAVQSMTGYRQRDQGEKRCSAHGLQHSLFVTVRRRMSHMYETNRKQHHCCTTHSWKAREYSCVRSTCERLRRWNSSRTGGYELQLPLDLALLDPFDMWLVHFISSSTTRMFFATWTTSCLSGRLSRFSHCGGVQHLHWWRR